MIGYDDPVLPTKVLRDFITTEKREEKMRMMVGVLEGKVVQAVDLVAVAKLPKKNARCHVAIGHARADARASCMLEVDYSVSSSESFQLFKTKRKGRAICQQQKESYHRKN